LIMGFSVAGVDCDSVWVAAAIVGGREARGVMVGETDSANPPQARIGRVNKIKSRFMLGGFVADVGGFRVYNFILRRDFHVAGEFLHVFGNNSGRTKFGKDIRAKP